MAKGKKLLVTLPDYERIFRVIHGVLSNERGNLAKACLFFGIIGARILEVHYKLRAVPVVGYAMYKLSGVEDILVLGSRTDDGITGTEQGFHCWVICDGFFIDFHAPLFREMFSTAGVPNAVTRKMFQKPIGSMVGSIEELTTPGSFLCGFDESLTKGSVDHFYSLLAHKDIENLCVDWFHPKAHKMQPRLSIGDQNGKVNTVTLSHLRVTGAW